MCNPLNTESNKVFEEDWLEDPLVEIKRGSYKPCELKGPNDEQRWRWRNFHFAARLKLDGAAYFCRQVLGAASMPDDLGLPLLAHRQLEWYLEAFFFELMSAYNILLQELNIIYAYDLGLEPKDVKWEKIKNKLPERLIQYMDGEWEKEWFDKIRKYRNVATHHYLVPLGSGKAGWGDKPLDYTQHQTFIHYTDDSGKFKDEEIGVCKEHLEKMVRYISSVWKEMAQEFQ